MTLSTVTYQDVIYSSTLDLSDMGKRCKIENGCFNLLTSDYPVKCPSDFIENILKVWGNNSHSISFKGRKTLSGIQCSDCITRRVYTENGYKYINVLKTKMIVNVT